MSPPFWVVGLPFPFLEYEQIWILDWLVSQCNNFSITWPLSKLVFKNGCCLLSTSFSFCSISRWKRSRAFVTASSTSRFIALDPRNLPSLNKQRCCINICKISRYHPFLWIQLCVYYTRMIHISYYHIYIISTSRHHIHHSIWLWLIRQATSSAFPTFSRSSSRASASTRLTCSLRSKEIQWSTKCIMYRK